ncbi:MAG: methionine adenosyltransferase [Clostridiaceae bacterium]|nr:methionine adenosyltransferase [Clostridiaceae bacterium]
MFYCNKDEWVFSSESVSEGHPDKVCDQISDAVLDALLASDRNARVACEVVASTGMVIVLGELSTTAYADIPQIVRNTVRDIGYANSRTGFDADSCAVLTSIDEQSPDIALGVNQALESKEGLMEATTGAGDQGIMFGYANSDTEELMPLPITLAHRLSKQLADVRKAGITNSLLPDGKTQVTVRYEGDKPVHIDAIVVSTQHYEHYELEEVREEVKKNVIVPVLDDSLFTDKTRVLINPTGRFVVGGPQGDTGLTGRKIICDTYGGFGHHGGGAFSGKDPTKVDRTASYAARYIAKNLVAAGLCSQCEVQLAYAIGVAQPVSLTISSFGSGTLDDGEMEALVRRDIDLRPAALIERFDMLRPIYQQVSNYGHFGRPDLDLPWEQLDSAKKWA